MRWVTLWLTAILLLSLICSAGCDRKIQYRSGDEQVFLFPAGTRLIAPAGRQITTDEAGRKINLQEVIVGYDGAVLSDGYLLKLFRAAHKDE